MPAPTARHSAADLSVDLVLKPAARLFLIERGRVADLGVLLKRHRLWKDLVEIAVAVVIPLPFGRLLIGAIRFRFCIQEDGVSEQELRGGWAGHRGVVRKVNVTGELVVGKAV